MRRLSIIVVAAALAVTLSSTGALYAADALNREMQALLDSYLAEARKKEPNLKAFSAEDGKRFFNNKRTHSVGNEPRSCSTCHTSDPSQQGKTPVGKVIEPMAHSVNKERFTDPKKVEKWFKRNCTWVLERECTPREKGDYVTYMMSI